MFTLPEILNTVETLSPYKKILECLVIFMQNQLTKLLTRQLENRH
jgi:hypothetical protein